MSPERSGGKSESIQRGRLLLPRVLFVLAILPFGLTFGYTTLRLVEGPQAVGGPFPGLRSWAWWTRGPWWPLVNRDAMLPRLRREAYLNHTYGSTASPLATWVRFVWLADSKIPRAAQVGYVGPWPDWGPIAQYYLYPRRVVMFSFSEGDWNPTPRSRDQWRTASAQSLTAWLQERPDAWVLAAERSRAQNWLGDRAIIVVQKGDYALYRLHHRGSQ
jgi:hypothetical protein